MALFDREGLRIVGLGVLVVGAYSLVHEQVTARISLTYFTVNHPPVFGGLQDPTLLGLIWGLVGIWGVGLPLSLLLAVAARGGRFPRLVARDLVRPLVGLLGVMVVVALLSGFIGYAGTRPKPAADYGVPQETPDARREAADRAPLNAVRASHQGSYAAGIAGGLAVCGLTFRRRLLLAVNR